MNGEMGKNKAIDILLVEDNPGDVRLTQEALKDGKLSNKLYVVGDGAEALAFLYRQGKYVDAVRPDLILLDLNLPKKSGREVLENIKQNPELKHIPVVILTTSQNEEDVLGSYNSYANCYVTKPMDVDRFVYVTKTIEGFWLSIVKLPEK